MTVPSQKSADQLRIAYEISTDENIIEAIIASFRAINFNIDDKETVLYDWIECDSLKNLNWDSNSALRVTTVIWNHLVEITCDTVTIHATRNGNDSTVPSDPD